ncbi:MAG TPA: hypothetical protein VGB38_06930, partial [bacterium]
MKRLPILFLLIAILALEAGPVIGGNATFPIRETQDKETNPSVAYNFQRDEFLVVWAVMQADVRDIYGRIVKGNGDFVGNAFPICISKYDKYSLDVAYGINNEYLVVWREWPTGKGDIIGARLDYTGKKLVQTNSSLSDTTFTVCNHDSSQSSAKVAANTINNTYLVVWQDLRNSTAYRTSYGYLNNRNYDIYGQRVAGDGKLIGSSSKENFQIAVEPDRDETYPDVAYHGTNGTVLNEWLVVYVRTDTAYSKQNNNRIWGTRVKGIDGSILNTWGEKGFH